jgi:hypothetical protein
MVLLAIFDHQSGKGFWRDYLAAAIAIASIVAVGCGVLLLAWAFSVVTK